MACCAGIQSEATSVLLESQHLRVHAHAGTVVCALEGKRGRNSVSTVAPEGIWIHERGILTASIHQTTHDDAPRRRDAIRDVVPAKSV